MKTKIKAGVACLARKTFDYTKAYELYKEMLEELNSDSDTEIIAVDGLVIEPEDAERAAEFLYSREVDCLIIISGTFHLGHLALIIKNKLDKPALLYGFKELGYDGGKIRLNSVCGVNLNASNLYKGGFKDYVYQIGNGVDTAFLDAVRINKALNGMRLAIIGYRAKGFFNVDVDEMSLFRQFGILVDHYEISDILNYKVDDALREHYGNLLTAEFDIKGLNDEQLIKVAVLAAKFKAFSLDKNITALAVRCWPEFADNYGISPCAAMSILQSEGLITACEGDIDCAVTMAAHRAAGGGTPFMADLSQIDFDAGFALMWHCGVAPCNLKDNRCTASLDTYFAGGRGVTADFVMKEGAISAMRFDSVSGVYRLFMTKGEGLPMRKELKGTYLKVRFARPVNEVLDSVVYNGIAHHVSVAYGDFTRAFEIFARIKGIEVISV